MKRREIFSGVCAVLLTLWISDFALFALAAADRRLGKRWDLYQRGRSVLAAGGSFDFRTPLELWKELQGSDPSAVPLITPNYFTEIGGAALHQLPLFPLGGVANATTIYCNENGPYRIYRSDEIGFANPQGEWSRRSQLHAILLGDSFGHGACVPWGQGIAERLSQNGRGVLNLSFARQGPLSYLATLVEYAQQASAQHLVWLHFEGNDLWDLDAEWSNPHLRRYLEPGYQQQLASRQAEVNTLFQDLLRRESLHRFSTLPRADATASFGRGWLTLPHLRRLLLPSLGQSGAPLGIVPGPHTLPRLRQILGRAKAEAEQRGATFWFVYLPEWKTFAPHRGTSRVVRDDLSLVKAAAHAFVHEKHFLDVGELFAQTGDALQYFPQRIEGHYTAAGYQLVAEALRSRWDLDRNK